MKKLLSVLSIIGLSFLICSCTLLFEDFYLPIFGELNHGTYYDYCEVRPNSTSEYKMNSYSKNELYIKDDYICLKHLIVLPNNKVHYYEELTQYYIKESNGTYVEIANPQPIKRNEYWGTYHLGTGSRCIFKWVTPETDNWGAGPISNDTPWCFRYENDGIKFYTKGNVLGSGRSKKFYSQI